MPKGYGRPTNRSAKKSMGKAKSAGKSLMANVISDAQWGKLKTRKMGHSQALNRHGSVYKKGKK